MSGKRYTESFKIEAVGQVLQRGFSVPEVSDRLGVTPKSLYDWIKKYGDQGEQHRSMSDQQTELRKLRAELKRVTEERDELASRWPVFAGIVSDIRPS